MNFAFKESNANFYFFSIIKNCVQRNDVVIRCANERFRRCISLIANFVCDYEKQILIIDVKSEQHCIICRVSSKTQKNLENRWSFRTHEFMQRQIQRQRVKDLDSRHEDWIHATINFVWDYSFVNIHEIMMIDILHQLFRRMIMHFLIWIQSLLKKKMSIRRRRREQTIRMIDLSDLDKLNARFRKISSFIDLKIFQKFFEIKQWTKKSKKSLFVRSFRSLFRWWSKNDLMRWILLELW